MLRHLNSSFLLLSPLLVVLAWVVGPPKHSLFSFFLFPFFGVISSKSRCMGDEGHHSRLHDDAKRGKNIHQSKNVF